MCSFKHWSATSGSLKQEPSHKTIQVLIIHLTTAFDAKSVADARQGAQQLWFQIHSHHSVIMDIPTALDNNTPPDYRYHVALFSCSSRASSCDHHVRRHRRIPPAACLWVEQVHRPEPVDAPPGYHPLATLSRQRRRLQVQISITGCHASTV